MAYLVNSSILINDSRELIGVNTAGINTALYVGADIQLDAGSGIVTATSFVGSGADLTDIDANVIVSDGIPTGISTTEGDLYYDSTDLKLFAYYDNNWVEASPVPPGATSLEVTNEAGITTAVVDLLTETLTLAGTTNQVSVGVNSTSDTITFGLSNDVAIGGSMTAGEYYGDGSNLSGVGLSTTGFYEVAGIQAGIATITGDTTIGGELTISDDLTVQGNAQFGNFFTDSIAFVGRIIGSFDPLVNNSVDLGESSLAWRDIYLARDLVGGGTANVVGFNSVTATEYYGDGSNLTGIRAVEVTSQDNQDNTDYRMPFLSQVGAGASIYVDETANEEFTYNPSTGILKAKEFDALSDARLKTNIVDIEDALGKVDQLRGVEYDWVNGSGSSVGIIAQELQEVYPQLVSDNGERLTVNYNGLVGLLISAVKEISAELSDLKSRM